MCFFRSCIRTSPENLPKKSLIPQVPERPSVSCAVSPVTPVAWVVFCGVLRGHAGIASLEVHLLPLQISLILEASRSASVCPEVSLDKQPGVAGFDVVNYTREYREISSDMQKRGAALWALKSCLSSCCLLSKVGLGQDR